MSTEVKIVSALLALVLALALPVAGIILVVMIVAGGEAQAAMACGADTAGGVIATGPVRLPISGPYMATSEYGMRSNPTNGVYQLHAGIDLASPNAAPILAAQSGRVRFAGLAGGAGNLVEIDHGAGVVTRYMHQSVLLVHTGQLVGAGQQIGVQGSTGDSTGPHLHFEVRINGTPTNPRPWLTAAGVAVAAPGAMGVGPAIDHNADPLAGGVLASVSAAATPTAAGVVTGPLPPSVGIWKGQQVTNAAHIIRTGQSMGLDAWTITVGVMTAMGESGLTVLDRGDAAGPDSRGLFQQRDSWGPYATRMDPDGSARLFFTALTKVPGYHQLSPTMAAHRTQRNADPNHYARFWPDAVTMVSTLTADPNLLASLGASGGEMPACDPEAATSTTTSPAGANPTSHPAGTPAPAPNTAAADGPCPPLPADLEASLPPAASAGSRCAAAAFPGLSPTRSAAGVDWEIPGYATTAGRARGWQLAEWAKAHAGEHGITSVTFDGKTWKVGDSGWAALPFTTAFGEARSSYRDRVSLTF